jgi:hypothetical protein
MIPARMREAPAGVGHELWLFVAPACQGVGPIVGAARIERVLTTRDDAAVHDTREHRRHLSGGDRDHRLVKESQTFLNEPLLDANVALEMQRHSGEIRVAKTLADLAGTGCCRVCAFVIAGLLSLERNRHEEVALFDAVVPGAFDKALRAAEPSAGRSDLSSDREAHADEEPSAGGAEPFARIEVRVVGALEDREVVVHEADHRGRRREQLEVIRSQRRRLVRAQQRFVGVQPRPPGVRVATLLELVDDVLHARIVARPGGCRTALSWRLSNSTLIVARRAAASF